MCCVFHYTCGQFQGKLSFGQFWKRLGLGQTPHPPIQAMPAFWDGSHHVPLQLQFPRCRLNLGFIQYQHSQHSEWFLPSPVTAAPLATREMFISQSFSRCAHTNKSFSCLVEFHRSGILVLDIWSFMCWSTLIYGSSTFSGPSAQH